MTYEIVVRFTKNRRFGIWHEETLIVTVSSVLSVAAAVRAQVHSDHPETTAIRIVKCKRQDEVTP